MKAMKKIFVILALFMVIGQMEFVQAGESAGTDRKKTGYIAIGLAAAIAAGYGIYRYFFKPVQTSEETIKEPSSFSNTADIYIGYKQNNQNDYQAPIEYKYILNIPGLSISDEEDINYQFGITYPITINGKIIFDTFNDFFNNFDTKDDVVFLIIGKKVFKINQDTNETIDVNSDVVYFKIVVKDTNKILTSEDSTLSSPMVFLDKTINKQIKFKATIHIPINIKKSFLDHYIEYINKNLKPVTVTDSESGIIYKIRIKLTKKENDENLDFIEFFRIKEFINFEILTTETIQASPSHLM